MSTRRKRVLLWLTACVLIAASCAAVGVHLVLPVKVQAASQEQGELDPDIESSEDLDSLSGNVDAVALQAVAQRDFRRRLFDPPVQAPSPPPPKPLPPIELLSTVLPAQGEPYAWVRDGQTNRRVAVGDVLGPADNSASITRIESSRIVIHHENQEHDLLHPGQGGAQR